MGRSHENSQGFLLKRDHLLVIFICQNIFCELMVNLYFYNDGGAVYTLKGSGFWYITLKIIILESKSSCKILLLT